MFDFKPMLSSENSILASAATVALVLATYGGHVGPVADVHASDAHDVNLSAGLHKGGWFALATVSAIALLAKDMNVFILGGGAIIVEEVMYRHALMTHPGTGKMATPTAAAYVPAGMPAAA